MCGFSAGATLCVKVFNDTGAWKDAARSCDGQFHSDLFNVRQFEKMFKGSAAYITILRDLELTSMFVISPALTLLLDYR